MAKKPYTTPAIFKKGHPQAQGRDAALRDRFAGLAMHAELLSAGSYPGPAKALAQAAEDAGRSLEERIAHLSYRMADAMLAERRKGARS